MQRALPVRKNNFDMLRLLLAFLVFLYHVSVLTQAPEFVSLAKYLSAEFAVDAFFVVSGFLIFMSYENSSSVRSYFLKRLRRIAPAYITVILLSALCFYFVSSFGVSEYFSLSWLKYFVVNSMTLNFLQHELPGVFAANHMSAVNGALWTIKVEVMFYCAVPLVVCFFKKINKLVVMVVVYMLAIAYSLVMLQLEQKTGSHVYLILERQLPGQMAFFISGAFLYYYFEYFKKYSTQFFLLGCIVFLSSKLIALSYLYPAALAVIVVYATMCFRYLGNWGKYGDFSFGVYIWHFPLTQLFIHLGYFDSSPYWALAGLSLTVLLFAYLSWHIIEKWFLRQSSHYRTAED